MEKMTIINTALELGWRVHIHRERIYLSRPNMTFPYTFCVEPHGDVFRQLHDETVSPDSIQWRDAVFCEARGIYPWAIPNMEDHEAALDLYNELMECEEEMRNFKGLLSDLLTELDRQMLEKAS